jgi:hypothetical protein
MLVNWGGSGCRRLTVARYRPERTGSENRADRSGPLVLMKCSSSVHGIRSHRSLRRSRWRKSTKRWSTCVQVKRAIVSFWSDKACGILCILHTYIPSMGGRPHCRLSFVHGQEYGRPLEPVFETRRPQARVSARSKALIVHLYAIVKRLGVCNHHT